MQEFLLELFSEEMPASLQYEAINQLKSAFDSELQKNNVNFTELKLYASPRRLVVLIVGLPRTLPDLLLEKKGPRIDASADAIEGFVKSSGLKKEELEIRETNKGSFYFAVINKKGEDVADFLKKLTENILQNFYWPKSMRWGANNIRWIRPLKSIVAILDGKVVNIEFGHLKASNITYGHRFLAKNQKLKVTNFTEYSKLLEDNFVIFDHDKRKAMIKEQAENIAKSNNIVFKLDQNLLDEVAGLVEYPNVLLGRIEDKFMQLPEEVLITSMKVNQKYFNLFDHNGRLVPEFLFVSNNKTQNDKKIIEGNQMVLRARLRDAEFFYNVDKEKGLDYYSSKLKHVTFHTKLGTVFDKAERISALSSFIGEKLKLDISKLKRASLLAKADLVSSMVGEFPELQAIIGSYYAMQMKEDKDIVDAIRNHYKPLGPSDFCPSNPYSAVVAIADKIDNLVGLFYAGEKPTGSKDPYALRRSALGLIRLITENSYRIPLEDMLLKSCDLYNITAAAKISLVEELLEFIKDRIKVILKNREVRQDVILAVLSDKKENDLVKIIDKAASVTKFVDSENGKNIIASYKRAVNILAIEEKKDKQVYKGDIIQEIISNDRENELYKIVTKLQPLVSKALNEEKYNDIASILDEIKTPISNFFDQVIVNDEKQDIRINRLNLLAIVRALLNDFADFTKIES